jgi:hypothetical protein
VGFRKVRTRWLFILLMTVALPAAINAASLEPATLKAWEEYVESANGRSANGRMEQRLSPGNVFLWVDEDSERLAKVRAGQIVVSPVAYDLQNALERSICDEGRALSITLELSTVGR